MSLYDRWVKTLPLDVRAAFMIAESSVPGARNYDLSGYESDLEAARCMREVSNAVMAMDQQISDGRTALAEQLEVSRSGVSPEARDELRAGFNVLAQVRAKRVVSALVGAGDLNRDNHDAVVAHLGDVDLVWHSAFTHAFDG